MCCWLYFLLPGPGLAQPAQRSTSAQNPSELWEQWGRAKTWTLAWNYQPLWVVTAASMAHPWCLNFRSKPEELSRILPQLCIALGASSHSAVLGGRLGSGMAGRGKHPTEVLQGHREMCMLGVLGIAVALFWSLGETKGATVAWAVRWVALVLTLWQSSAEPNISSTERWHMAPQILS